MLNDILSRARRWVVRDILDAMERQTAAIEFASLVEQTLSIQYRGVEILFFLPDGDHDRIQKRILIDRTFYEEPVLSFLKDQFGLKGLHIIDVGANIGNHSVFFGRIGCAASCLSIEPAPRAFNTLTRNIEINKLSSTTRLRNAALSSTTGRMAFAEYYAGNQGMSAFVPSSAGNIESVTLNEIAIGHVDLLKIDVEGSAFQVLDGGRDVLQTYRPAVFVELIRGEFTAVNDLLRRHGYSLTKRFQGGNYLYEFRS